MEFNFDITDIFNQPIVEINRDLIPTGFRGDRRTLWNAVNRVSEVVNAIGAASAAAQGLPKPVTTTERLKNSQHKLYLLIDQNANAGRGAITGMLRTGAKGLYIFDKEGQYHQVSPPCLLDFYIHESRQRKGLGKQLFQHMLQKESVDPSNIAIDRPSQQLMSFLNKHYGLNSPVKQTNNYVVFEGFFPRKETQSFPQQMPKRLGLVRKESANGLQSQSSPFGRYVASRPATSVGKLLNNDMEDQTRTMTSMPVLNRSVPLTNVRECQSTPNYSRQSTDHDYNQGVGSTIEHQGYLNHPLNGIDSKSVNIPAHVQQVFQNHQSNSVPRVQINQNQYPMQNQMSHETTNCSSFIPTQNEMPQNHLQGIQSLAHFRRDDNTAYQRNDQIIPNQSAPHPVDMEANDERRHQEHPGHTQSMDTMNQQNQIRHTMPGMPVQNQNLYHKQQYPHTAQREVGERVNNDYHQSVDMMIQHQNNYPYPTQIPNVPMKSIPGIPAHIEPTRNQPHPQHMKNPQGVQSLPQIRAGEQLHTGHQLYAQESTRNTPMNAVYAQANQSSHSMNASQQNYASHVGSNMSVGQLQPSYMHSQCQGDNPEPTMYQQNQVVQPHIFANQVAELGNPHQQVMRNDHQVSMYPQDSQSSPNANATPNIQAGYPDHNHQESTQYATAVAPQFSQDNPAQQSQINPEGIMQYGTGPQQISEEQVREATMKNAQNASSSRIVPGYNNTSLHSGDAMQHMEHQIPGGQHNVVNNSRNTKHTPQGVTPQEDSNAIRIPQDRTVSGRNQEKPPTDVSCEQTINHPTLQKQNIDPFDSRNMSNPNYISQVQYNPLQKTPVASRTTVPMKEGVLEYGYPPQLSRAQANYFQKPDIMSIH